MKVFVVDLLCVSPNYDRYLCEALRDEGIEARLWSISFHLDRSLLRTPKIVRAGWIVDIAARLPLPWVSVRRAIKLAEYLVNLGLLLSCCALQRPQLVHVQWLPLLEYSRLELYWLRLIKAIGCRIVMTVHNVLPHDSGERCVANYHAAYRLAEHLIAHTSLAKRSLIDDFGIEASAISVIPHGPMLHDLPRVDKAAARRLLGVSADAQVVLFVGTCKPYKGLELLVASWRGVARLNRQALLIIAGNGEPRFLQELRTAVAEAGTDGSIRLDLRGLSNDEIVAYHVVADVIVLPYTNITQSGALLTAMAFGRAIVASDIPGFRETLKDDVCALLVAPGDPSALADSLNRALNEPGLSARLGREALRQVMEHYGWPSIARATVACYHDVLHGRRR
jgi:glycosyltransferase involved in cell wall biosynthesis